MLFDFSLSTMIAQKVSQLFHANKPRISHQLQRTLDYFMVWVIPESKEDSLNYVNDDRYECTKYTRPQLKNISLDSNFIEQSADLFILRMEAIIVRRMALGLVKIVRGESLGFLHIDIWGFIKKDFDFYCSTSTRTVSGNRRFGNIDYEGYKTTRWIQVISFNDQSHLPPLFNKKWFIKKWVNGGNKFKAMITSLVVKYDELDEDVTCTFEYHTWTRVEDGWELC